MRSSSTLSLEQMCAWRRPVPCWPCPKLFSLAWAMVNSEIASTQTCLVPSSSGLAHLWTGPFVLCGRLIGSTIKAFQAREHAQPLLADLIHPAHSCAAPSSTCAARTHHLLPLYYPSTSSSHPFVARINTCHIADSSDELDACMRRPRSTQSISADHLHSTTSSAHQPSAVHTCPSTLEGTDTTFYQAFHK